MPELNVVTGAFGYTGKYITRRLLSMGMRVKTLTGHPDRPNPFGEQVSVAPFNFENPRELVKDLEGATTLYNTYWVRFSHGQVTFDRAIENTKTLVRAAREAGVHKIVHISITNASPQSPLPYFRGKAILEEAIMGSGIPYAILRPTVIFGVEDILINNIAWLARRFPVFMVPGLGDYQLQPIYVEDVAELAVSAASLSKNVTMDAVGPEVYTFDQFVRLIAEKAGRRTRILHAPPGLALLLSRLLGLIVGDVILTRDEVAGLMAGLLVSPGPVTGNTSLSAWLTENAEAIGTNFASELDRHYRP